MKAFKILHNYTGIIFLVALLLIAGITGCSRKVHLLKSTVVPAAEGTIRWKKDRNNNYAVSIKIIRLAEPSRLQPPKNVYVVWMNTKENGIKNIGQLKSSSGILSKTLKASLNTVTSFEPVSFFITAEQDASITYPGSQVVLNTR